MIHITYLLATFPEREDILQEDDPAPTFEMVAETYPSIREAIQSLIDLALLPLYTHTYDVCIRIYSHDLINGKAEIKSHIVNDKALIQEMKAEAFKFHWENH